MKDKKKGAAADTTTPEQEDLKQGKDRVNIPISKYESRFSTKKRHYVPGCIPHQTDAYTELENIRSGTYKHYIDKLLSLPPEEQKAYKQQHLPSITFSCQTKEYRKTENIISNSKLLNGDIDGEANEHITDWGQIRDQLVADMGKRLVAAWLSCRRNGVTFLLRIYPKLHKETLLFIAYEFKRKYNLNLDTSCSDVIRLRFVSYDPHAYINYDYDNIPVIVPTENYKTEKKKILRQVERPKLIKVTDSDTPELFKNAVAFAEYQFKTETGLDFEFIPGNRHRFLISVAGYCNVRGMSMEYCTDQAIKQFNSADYDVARPIRNVYETYSDQHGTVDLAENQINDIQTWISHTYELRRNFRTRYIECDGVPMQQKDFNSIYLDAKRVFPKLNYDLLDRTINSNFTETYDPIADFFEEHKQRQPNGAIRALADTIDSDTGLDGGEFFPDFVHYFLQKWIVSIIASAHGKHSPLMLVLTGSLQGTGKTEWLRRLLPNELMPYYAESKLDAGKDDEILMTQKLLIMDDEMGGKSKKDEKRLKELLSKQIFSLREPYGRNNVDLQRLAVLCGTTNDNEILSDPTGNRRIIPINVLSINHEAYNAIDKIDVLIEAYHLYKSGFEWQLTTKDVQDLNSNTSGFEQPSIERDLLSEYFKVPDSEKDPVAEFLTPSKIKSIIEMRSYQKVNLTRLGQELKKMGFVKVAKKKNGVAVRGYYVIDNAKEVVGL
ncbi:MAG: hypothetical protein ICV66_08845 [Chitinophagaceae bacterium]|nr:hypothetical protein [Chitinophagaceae bacterium]